MEGNQEYAGETKKKGISRRAFLIGAGVLGLGAILYKLGQKSEAEKMLSEAEKSLSGQPYSETPQYPQEPSRQTQPQEKGIIGSTLGTLEEEKAKREIERTAYAFADAIKTKNKDILENILCVSDEQKKTFY